MRKIYVLSDLGMNFQIVILFFVTAIIIEKALTNECGKTTSLQDGNTATITFTPNSNFVAYSITWIHRLKVNLKSVVVFNSNGTASQPTRYIEELSNGTYILKIHDVTINDSGLYNVRCYSEGAKIVYSETTTLTITRVPTSSLQPSTWSTKQQFEIVTTQHVRTEEKSLHEENDDGALIAPVTGGVVGTVVVVVACVVLIKVYQSQCKKQNAVPPAQSKAKRSITEHLLGESGSAGMTIMTEEIPEYASVLPKDQRKGAEKMEDITDGEDECPEYSNVVPKSERTDAQKNIQTKSICDTTEAANQLVYAELDLEHPKANEKDPEQRKDPDNVQVDHSKTGRSHDSKQVAEQLEQTEYVTIEFSKTE